MNPVIQRELREQSRSPVMFRMRLAAAAVLLATLAWGFLFPGEVQAMPFGPPAASAGSVLFLQLHRALVFIILAVTPALTADAIARERREATLGLLGLTPLRPLSLALGKSAANTLRALTLWLAPLPILIVPLLMGGVSGLEVATVITFQLVLLAVGLSAGLVASTVTIEFRRSLALAYLLELALVSAVLVLSFFVASLAPTVLTAVTSIPLRQAVQALWLAGRPDLVFGSPFGDRYSTNLPRTLAQLRSVGGPHVLTIWAAGLGTFVAAGALVVLAALRFVA